jgi:hypothetical protein
MIEQPKPGALSERFVTEGKYSYFARLDEYKELNMTSFGKMKLSVIPEGVIYSTYNYFKTQERFPSYDKFFDSCIMHAKTADIDMKPRWCRFYDACQLKAIDPKSPTSLAVPFTEEPRTFNIKEVEEEFWRVEKYKLTSAGSKVMEKIGDPQNPYRVQMMQIAEHLEEPGLFKLYLLAYPKTNPRINPLEPSLKNLEDYEVYTSALQKEIDHTTQAPLDPEVETQHVIGT